MQAADATAGKAVYDKSCKSCHGPDGAGNPAIAKMFKVDMRDLKSADVQAMSDDDLKENHHRRQRQDEAGRQRR
jgi:cytochrome c553